LLKAGVPTQIKDFKFYSHGFVSFDFKYAGVDDSHTAIIEAAKEMKKLLGMKVK